jgi:hypothetical protein
MGFGLCPEEAMKDVLVRCHKKTAVQACNRLVSTFEIILLDYSVFDYLLPLFLHVGSLIRNTIWCLFLQVKNKP